MFETEREKRCAGQVVPAPHSFPADLLVESCGQRINDIVAGNDVGFINFEIFHQYRRRLMRNHFG